MSEIKKFYDDSAKDWAKDSKEDMTMFPIIRRFLYDIPKESMVLDIRCVQDTKLPEFEIGDIMSLV